MVSFPGKDINFDTTVVSTATFTATASSSDGLDLSTITLTAALADGSSDLIEGFNFNANYNNSTEDIDISISFTVKDGITYPTIAQVNITGTPQMPVGYDTNTNVFPVRIHLSNQEASDPYYTIEEEVLTG